VPRYFFHVFDDTVTMDEQGQVASGPPAAQAIALKLSVWRLRGGCVAIAQVEVVAVEVASFGQLAPIADVDGARV
jgi:hypothetical protein